MPDVSKQIVHMTAPTVTPELAAEWEKAADVLLHALPVWLSDAVREMAYVHNRQPLWAFVMGHVLKAYETGELSAPVLDPSWPRAFTGLPDPLNAQYKCVWCGNPFPPKRWRQKFCTNECGTAANHLEALDQAERAAAKAAAS